MLFQMEDEKGKYRNLMIISWESAESDKLHFDFIVFCKMK
jgi:hypothetical protein